MGPTPKFVLCTGASSLVGFGACTLLSVVSPKTMGLSPGPLFGDALFAVSLVCGPYFASKRGWLADDVPLTRALLAILPLLFLPIALLISFVGWGDLEEHWVRGFLHDIHRAMPQEIVGKLGFNIGITVSALLVALIVWFSVSILTKAFKFWTLLLFSGSCLLLGSSSWFALSLATRSNNEVVVLLVLFFFCFGVSYAAAVIANRLPLQLRRSVAALAGVLIICALAAACTYLFRKSSPEVRLPESAAPPLWTLDIAGAGCVHAYGGPDSSSAPNEIAFAADDTLGLAFPSSYMSLPNGGWKYSSCLLSIDALTGKTIANRELPLKVTSISGDPEGFWVASGDSRVLYSSDLNKIDEKNGNTSDRNPQGSPDPLKSLHIQNEATLQSTCGSDTRQLSDDRFLYAAGTRFLVCDSRGNLVASQEFVRPRVNFAALSRDHRRFALAVYVWGFGDPSYLEEETIAVYDAASVRPIFAVKSDPLPRQQSWAALSPDGSLLAVGAEHTVRLFRLP